MRVEPGRTRVERGRRRVEPGRGRVRRGRGRVIGRRWLLAAAGALGLVPLSTAAQATAPVEARPGSDTTLSPGERLPVREVRLDNGLRALLLPRPGAPTVAAVMQFGIGGVHEHLGTTGVAHLLEHMLFKGTETIGTLDVEAERALFEQADSVHRHILAVRPAAVRDSAGARSELERLESVLDSIEDEARKFVVSNEFDRILTRVGAQGLNATTTSEATSYFVELPSNRLQLFLELEADRMARPVFREFYTERDVVLEERRMRVESSPAGALFEVHLAAAFDVHPYGVPVVGHRSDLETLSRSDVAEHYRDFYGPNNAVLALVGSFDAIRAEEWIRSAFGPIARGLDPPVVHAVEPEQRGERRVELEWDAQPSLRIAWHVPESSHPDAGALSVLSSILTGSRTARLHRRLVTEESVATSIFSSMGPGTLYPRLFQIDVEPIAPATPAQLEEKIYEEIARIAADGPAPEEVERVRNQIAAGSIRRLQSNLGLAFQLAGSASLFGDWRETFRATEALRAVTAADVQRVADHYFGASNRTVAVLVPLEEAR